MSKVVQMVWANSSLVVLTDDGRIFENPYFATAGADSWYEVDLPLACSPLPEPTPHTADERDGDEDQG